MPKIGVWVEMGTLLLDVSNQEWERINQIRMGKMKYAPEVIDSWFEALETPYKDIPKRTQGFIVSLKDQWDRKKFLTEAQLEPLENIYAEYTN